MNKKIVLIVEDDEPLLNVIGLKLEKNNYTTLSARTVKDALARLAEHSKVDFIWLDHYLLGEEDGFDLAVKLKNNEQYKKIPIFVVSNTVSEDKVNAYLKLGVNKFFTKADHRLDEIIADMNNFVNP